MSQDKQTVYAIIVVVILAAYLGKAKTQQTAAVAVAQPDQHGWLSNWSPAS